MAILNSIYQMQIEIFDIKQIDAAENDYPVMESFRLNTNYDVGSDELRQPFNRELIVDTDYTIPFESLKNLAKKLISFSKKPQQFTFDLGEYISLDVKPSKKRGYSEFIIWYNGSTWEGFHEDKDALGIKVITTPQLIAEFAYALYDEWKTRDKIVA